MKNRARSLSCSASLGIAGIAAGIGVVSALGLAGGPVPSIHPAFAAAVAAPAYANRGPTIAIDDAPGHAATSSDVGKPLADLLSHDGYRVVAFQAPFSSEKLAGVDVLVIGADSGRAAAGGESAGVLGDRECDQIRDWVRGGGALLLALDATPSAAAGDRLAVRFGVEGGGGQVFDRVPGGAITTQLEFSLDNGGLGDHAIVRGRGRAEQIVRVRTFSGQSLVVPRAAAALLRLGVTAREAATRDDLEAEEFAARQEAGIAGSFSTPAAGRAQAIALRFGKGRLVVLGDAELLTARMLRAPDGRETSVGLNASGTDNRQFALNVVHWLSRLLK